MNTFCVVNNITLIVLITILSSERCISRIQGNNNKFILSERNNVQWAVKLHKLKSTVQPNKNDVIEFLDQVHPPELPREDKTTQYESTIDKYRIGDVYNRKKIIESRVSRQINNEYSPIYPYLSKYYNNTNNNMHNGSSSPSTYFRNYSSNVYSLNNNFYQNRYLQNTTFLPFNYGSSPSYRDGQYSNFSSKQPTYQGQGQNNWFNYSSVQYSNRNNFLNKSNHSNQSQQNLNMFSNISYWNSGSRQGNYNIYNHADVYKLNNTTPKSVPFGNNVYNTNRNVMFRSNLTRNTPVYNSTFSAYNSFLKNGSTTNVRRPSHSIQNNRTLKKSHLYFYNQSQHNLNMSQNMFSNTSYWNSGSRQLNYNSNGFFEKTNSYNIYNTTEVNKLNLTTPKSELFGNNLYNTNRNVTFRSNSTRNTPVYNSTIYKYETLKNSSTLNVPSPIYPIHNNNNLNNISRIWGFSGNVVKPIISNQVSPGYPTYYNSSYYISNHMNSKNNSYNKPQTNSYRPFGGTTYSYNNPYSNSSLTVHNATNIPKNRYNYNIPFYQSSSLKATSTITPSFTTNTKQNNYGSLSKYKWTEPYHFFYNSGTNKLNDTRNYNFPYKYSK